MVHASVVLDIVSVVVTLLLVSAAVLAGSKRFNFPFTVALTLLGIWIAWLSGYYPAISTLTPGTDTLPDIIMFVFLPALVFQSAYELDTKLLRDDLSSVLGLAVPGLLVSTLIIGLIVHTVTPIGFPESLLLGAILSATDPVAVVALFKNLGASRRLTVLVEGESLFNDATAIVLSKILIIMVAAEGVSSYTVLDGAFDFFTVFTGGLLFGAILGLLAAEILGMVRSDPNIEITIATTLAYLSFLIAETLLHVSGVMATVAAGLVMGSRGRMKISPSVRHYLESFLEYMTFMATALLFLFVGLQIKLSALAEVWYQLLWVIVAMLVSRALVVYGLVPLVQRYSHSEPVSLPYRTVIFWGGLRGAIALAIVMSLPPLEQLENFVTLVTGAVLFTLLAQGLTMDRLVRMLQLDHPPLSDRFAYMEGRLASKQRALDRSPELMEGGLFSGQIAQRLKESYTNEIDRIKTAIRELRRSELDYEKERILLTLLAFSEEKAIYIEMLNKGHLSEKAFHELSISLDLQIDALRHQTDYKIPNYHHLKRRRLEKWFITALDKVPILSVVGDRFHMGRIAQDYEVAWGRYQGGSRVLKELETFTRHESLSEKVVEDVSAMYVKWRETARDHLDNDAEQLPEFVNAIQERLGNRLMRIAEVEAIEEQRNHGAIPESVAEEILTTIALDMIALKGMERSKLKFEPTELLQKIPFLSGLSKNAFSAIAGGIKSRVFAKKEVIIQQGEKGDALFFITRGVVRVSVSNEDGERDLATLMAGDFFGEMALLHSAPRAATVRAVTACSLFELNRKVLFSLMHTYPVIRTALENADRKRREETERE